MLKFILPLLFLATTAHAQEFDLSTLPSDYAFVSQEPDARVTVRLIERKGDIWFFEEIIDEMRGTRKFAQIEVNRASQTTFWAYEGQSRRYTPHDCGPSLGVCSYKWIEADDTFDMRSETKLLGDIWISDTYFLDQGERVFWSRDCTIYDDYGFWIDFVRLYSDGDSHEGARERPGPDRLTELWRVCDPPDFIS